jgi:transcriptional regulator with XRE-family HTH domain
MNTKAKEFFQREMGAMTFGTFLTGARTSLDLTQAQLARKLGVSRSMVCDIEKSRVLVSPALAVRIAHLAGFPPKFAVKYCLLDQLRRAKIKMKLRVEAA